MKYADSIPTISTVVSTFTIASFAATSLAAGLLTVSTASLQSEGVFLRSSSSLTYNPTRNIFVCTLTLKQSLTIQLVFSIP